jgi:hypothetical protein
VIVCFVCMIGVLFEQKHIKNLVWALPCEAPEP